MSNLQFFRPHFYASLIMAEDNFSRAKELLLRVVDTVISITAKERVSLEQGQSSGSHSSLQPPWAESSSSSHISRILAPQRSTNGSASSSLQSVQPSRTLESQKIRERVALLDSRNARQHGEKIASVFSLARQPFASPARDFLWYARTERKV